METPKPSGRSLRGFASMDKAKQREIASKGGRAAHEKGTAHEFTSVEASTAAKSGHERGTAHEFTPEEARIAGRKGGMARAANRLKANGATSTETPAPATNPREAAPVADYMGHNPA
jgi:general stress protein YciG